MRAPDPLRLWLAGLGGGEGAAGGAGQGEGSPVGAGEGEGSPVGEGEGAPEPCCNGADDECDIDEGAGCDLPEDDDGFEDNDAPDASADIVAGDHTGLLLADDDWYALDVLARTKVDVRADFESVDVDLDLVLLQPGDEVGRQESASARTNGSPERLQWANETGGPVPVRIGVLLSRGPASYHLTDGGRRRGSVWECLDAATAVCSTMPEGRDDRSLDETCDGADDDCDGETDEDDPALGARCEADGREGDCAVGHVACGADGRLTCVPRAPFGEPVELATAGDFRGPALARGPAGYGVAWGADADAIWFTTLDLDGVPGEPIRMEWGFDGLVDLVGGPNGWGLAWTPSVVGARSVFVRLDPDGNVQGDEVELGGWVQDLVWAGGSWGVLWEGDGTHLSVINGDGVVATHFLGRGPGGGGGVGSGPAGLGRRPLRRGVEDGPCVVPTDRSGRGGGVGRDRPGRRVREPRADGLDLDGT